MTFTLSAWVVWGVLSLALFGLWAVLWQACQLARYLVERWRDRKEPLSADSDEACEAEAPDGDRCWFDEGHDGLHSWEQRLAELPPERTWEQMTSHQLPLIEQPATGYLIRSKLTVNCAHPFGSVPDCPWCGLTEERERRPPAWEAEHRAAYESLGFDYPSGLLARVRELTP